MTQLIEKQLIIPIDLAGLRLDQALAKLLPDYSRARIQTWLQDNQITITPALRAKDKVKGNEIVNIKVDITPECHDQPEAIDLSIIYEDDALIVINKPVGLIVHPGAGNPSNTLLNALLHHAPLLQEIPRAGIIHRIDKDTSGLLVVAKTLSAHTFLVRELQKHHITRVYHAIVRGALTGGGTIEAPIGRHPKIRTQMAVTEKGKPAITHYRLLERFRDFTYLQVTLETGRTHQIRVHMAHLNHPLVGDTVYDKRMHLPKNASSPLIAILQNFKRQALHAYQLTLTHPTTKESMTWQADIPKDIQQLLNVLREENTS